VKLNRRLEEIKTRFISGADPMVLDVMQQASRELADSGLLDSALGLERRAPQFTLNDERGVDFALTDFLSRGPLILHFFRGFW